jgi:hypothetical protein
MLSVVKKDISLHNLFQQQNLLLFIKKFGKD